jgi:hypothetical protein
MTGPELEKIPSLDKKVDPVRRKRGDFDEALED